MNACGHANGAWLRAAWFLLVCLVFARPSAAQPCQPQWQPFDPSTASYPGTNGTVYATTVWDPDGPGPIPAKLVVAGDFTIAGSVFANNIAAYDLTTGAWSALGSGMGGSSFPYVSSLATLPNGDLVAGGSFLTAGGVSANRIARWNGSAWSPLGTGMGSVVYALIFLPNGHLVAGGAFLGAGGVSANRIARWNGSAWSALGTGVDGDVLALTTLPNGDLVAGGYFTSAGGVSANSIARWNGSAWSPLGMGMGGLSINYVLAFTTLPNGDLVAGGIFASAGGVNASRIACWNGSAWSPLGAGTGSGFVSALTTLSSGELIVGGNFLTTGGVNVNRIARWNGNTWSPLGTGMNSGVSAFATLPNGDLVAGGYFTTAGGVVAPFIARWGLPAGCGPTCDTIDFNADGLFPDTLDIDDFLAVFAGLPCPSTGNACNTDIDFNNDGLFPDTADIDSFLSVFAGGACV